jgi:hypothetical protein
VGAILSASKTHLMEMALFVVGAIFNRGFLFLVAIKDRFALLKPTIF